MKVAEFEVEDVEGIGPVVIVENRPEVLESELSLLGTYGVECFGATNEAEAWIALNKAPDPVTALVDKALDSGKDAGISLLEDFVRRRAGIRPYLVTAFDLTKGEQRRMNEIAATVLTKGHFNLVEVLRSSYEPKGVKTVETSIPDVLNRLLQKQAEADEFRQKYAELHSAWVREAAVLVNRLRDDARTSGSAGEIYVAGEAHSYEDLVMHVVHATPLGMELVNLHNEAVESLIKRARAARR